MTILNTTNLLTAALSAAFLIALGGCQAPAPLLTKEQQAAFASIKTVAVFPFSGGTSPQGARPGDAVAGALVEALRREAPQFTLLERTRIADLLAERRGAGGSSQEQEAVGIAKLLNVDAVIAGEVRQYSRDDDEYSVGASVRIIDVKTGRMFWSCSGDGSRKKSYTEAVKETVAKLVLPLKELPKPAGRTGGY